MNASMERLTEAEQWTCLGQHQDQHDRSNPQTGDNPWPSVDDLSRVRRSALLTSVVKAQILPRLAQLRRSAAATDASVSALSMNDDTQELVGLLLNREASAAAAFVDSLRRRGATPGSLYLGVMTQAARILGEMWDQDHCDFAQVTISMGWLQQVLRSLSPHFQVEAVIRAQPDSVVLAPGPGEQHTFGLLMVGEFFKREGWRVAGGPATSASDAALIVRLYVG